MKEVIDLQPPLNGYIVTETVRRVYLPAVMSLEPGQGNVSELLASLTAEYDEVIVPGVISETLAGMLQRRGFKRETQWAAEMDEHVVCLVWRKQANTSSPVPANVIEAASELTNLAAMACTEPRAFHANENGMQQALGRAVGRMRVALVQAGF